MTDVSITERAEDDLRSIFVHGLQTFGLHQARRYAAELDTVFKLLASQPRMGRLATPIGPDIRRHEHRAHVVLYEETSEGITILAVVHASAQRRLRL